jgi:hypothetical protein
VFARHIVNALVLIGAFVNAVPARADFHPIKFVHDPVQDDLMGSGFEVERAPTARAAKREAPDRKIAETWRRLAGQLRWLASSVEGDKSEELLARANDYEARARQLEESGRA